MGPPRKIHRLVTNLTFDKSRGHYKWRSPLTGKYTSMGKDKAVAIERAKLMNAAVKLRQQEHDLAAIGKPVFDYVVDQYIANVVAYKPWADSTRDNKLHALAMYKRELGAGLLFSQLDRIGIANWLDRKGYLKADTYNEHRANLADVWKYAISRGWADINEAEAVYERSTSAKIPANRKTRAPLTLDQFWLIHGAAEPWLQNAMEFSLITLQARTECCNLHDNQLRNGRLYVIRQKTATANDMAFLSIAMTDELDKLRRRSRADGLICPYWIRRRPVSQRPQHQQTKPHPFYVLPQFLSKAFARARDAALPDHEWDGTPTSFHEIRGLGARTYLELGFSQAYVNVLLGHADEKTSQIYTANPDGITDADFNEVEAGMKLRDVR